FVEQRLHVGFRVEVDVAELEEGDVRTFGPAIVHLARERFDLRPGARVLADPRVDEDRTFSRGVLASDGQLDAVLAREIAEPLDDVGADRLVAEEDPLLADRAEMAGDDALRL